MRSILQYRKVRAFEVHEALKERMELTDYQKGCLTEVLESLPFVFFEFPERKRTHPLMRLTAPFYIAFWILVLLSIPIKWMLTGSRYYKHESIIPQTLARWQAALGF